jgi:hypothetical protein
LLDILSIAKAPSCENIISKIDKNTISPLTPVRLKVKFMYSVQMGNVSLNY